MQKALAINPRYAEVHDGLAQSPYDRGKLAQVLTHWREGTPNAAAFAANGLGAGDIYRKGFGAAR